jgi:chaperone modulatory protein CbpM
MITLDMLCVRVGGVGPDEVEHWIAAAWMRAEGRPGARRFRAIDVARARLIVTLRRDLGIDDEAVPVVLSLLDQLYAARRQMQRLRRAVEQAGGEEVRRAAAARE